MRTTHGLARGRWFWEFRIGGRVGAERARQVEQELLEAERVGVSEEAFTGDWPEHATGAGADEEASGNVRVGVANEQANTQAPVGACHNGYGLRDVNGSRVHCGVRRHYGGRRLRPGDVVGVLLTLPPAGLVDAAGDTQGDADMSAAGARSAVTKEQQHEEPAVHGEAWMYAYTAFGAGVGAAADRPVFPLQGGVRASGGEGGAETATGVDAPHGEGEDEEAEAADEEEEEAGDETPAGQPPRDTAVGAAGPSEPDAAEAESAASAAPPTAATPAGGAGAQERDDHGPRGEAEAASEGSVGDKSDAGPPRLPGCLPPLPTAWLPRHERLAGIAADDGAAMPASAITFFVNGRSCGAAFVDLTPAMRYFPAASCLRGGSVTLNPGPDFEAPPKPMHGAALAWRPLCQALDDQAAAQRSKAAEG